MADTPAIETKLLIHSDTTDGSTTFEDSSNSEHALTAFDQAHHEIDQKKFGATSIQFDGAGDYISIPDSADWHLGSGDFTIDLWAYPELFGSRRILLAQYNSGATLLGFWLEIDTTGHLVFGGTDPTVLVTTANTLTLNTWQHIAVVRSGNTVTIYIDGVADTNTLDVTGKAFVDIAFPLIIGTYSTLFYFKGYIDEIRILKGEAAWTANFTPHTGAYVLETAAFVSGVVTEESVPVARTVRAYDRSTGVFIAGTTSSAVDGSYSIGTGVYTDVFVVAFDDVAGTQYNAVILDKITL